MMYTPEPWEEINRIEAKEVFVVMQNNYRISRNIRAQWFFKNLNKTLTFKRKTCQLECTDEIEVISALPKYRESYKVESDTDTSCIKIVPDTVVHFLSTQYRLVFCLDLSSSISTIDIQHDCIYFQEIYSSLEQSLKSLSEPFFVPGSRFFFIPQIYITVIAHIPNCTTAAPQVLIQGWTLIPDNINELLELLKGKLANMCQLVKKVAATAREEQNQLMTSDDTSGSLADDGSKVIKKVLDLSADISTLKIIRYGILALQLLPENSSAGIIVITEGIQSFPNCKSLDSLLSQLRNSTIACSFLQLGSPFHPSSSFGRVPYKELMEFISIATCGAYFPAAKDMAMDTTKVNEMNIYHESLLFWNFQKVTTAYYLQQYEPSMKKDNYWHIDNPHFYSVAHQSRVKKKHTEGTVKVSLENLLSCRLREGYLVKSVVIDEVKNSTDVVLVLPWMLSSNIEYVITSTPARKATDIPCCHFELIVDGCYEFLHDVTCSVKKPIKSLYRKNVIAQFWNYIKNLSNTDQILMQLHSFAHNPVYYTIPDSIKNGVPLFYFPTNLSSIPVLSSKNVANMQFTSFWKPLCMLDINVWQKWMHAHRIGIVLQHDMPLPKNLHLPNSSGRYVHVQCRQATTALNSLLNEHSSFALVENHSYIKLLFNDPDKPPYSFYVIRVTSKPPCVVIRLAFLGGLPGRQRFEIVNDLRQKILNLKRATSKDSQASKQLSSNSPESNCCFLLKKPVEKILIRYEKLPTNFLTSVPDSQFGEKGFGSHKQSDSHLYVDALITLSKYLLLQRWIWTLQYESNNSLDLTSASKILYTLTNIRLEEGFRFCHSGSGIIYMVQEFPVQLPCKDDLAKPTPDTNCCVVQYILFPPHTNTTLKDSTSEDDDIELTEADGELQLITECWIEPQLGTTIMSPKLKYLDGLKFSEVSSALHKRDIEAVKVLTTFEHLCVLCERNSKLPCTLPPLPSTEGCEINVLQSSPSVINPQVNVRPVQENISVIPYCFNLLSLLPKCTQTEIIVSALHGNTGEGPQEDFAGNDILFNYFIDNIKSFHNLEILLTLEDNYIFPLLVHHRDRDTQENEFPFPHPEVNAAELFALNQSFLISANKTCCNPANSSLEVSDCSRRPLIEHGDLKEEYLAKWRCFVKGYSSSHVILSIIPASFNDLKKLYPQSFNLPANDSEMSKMDISQGESALAERPEADSCDKDSQNELNINKTESSGQGNIDNVSLSPELLYIPLYVYSGESSSVINELVSNRLRNKEKDNFIKYTFEYENCIEDQSNTSFTQVVTPGQCIEETEKQVKKPKRNSHYFNVKDHCSLIEKSHSKSFVYSVYRSLTLGNSVHKFDAIAAIDEICEESLLEIDITDFVSMICGHVKDYTTKHSVRQMHLASENGPVKTGIEDKVDKNNVETEKTAEKCLFPLSVLQKHQPCEHLHQKHLDIKEKFMNIIKSFFKVIPSRPDYFFFCHVDEDPEDTSVHADEEDSHEEDNFQDEGLIEFTEDYQGIEADKASNKFSEDVTSAKSLNTESSLSSIGRDTEPGSSSDKVEHPPLFVHFSCSVRRNKQEIKSCPLSSLPTCLNDVISCLDPDCSEIDLEDLRITLDITCLTVPSDIENPNIERQRVHSTSFSSSSPIPEADHYRKLQTLNENDDTDSSEAPSDTIQGGTLQNLSSVQKEAVLKCVDKIKWLLQDEKASVALDFYPITSDILNMVVEHVGSSDYKPCCIIKEIPLMFIYGADSLAKFIQAFKRMSPVGYRLEVVGETYYVVYDAEAAKKLNRPFGSLEPPLGIAEKFQIIKRNPHSDDRAELKKIAEEMKDSSLFNDPDYSSPPQMPHSDGLNDDCKSVNMNADAIFNILRDINSRKFQAHNYDSDTEDCEDNHQRKIKSHRKISLKKYDTFPNASKRTRSSPSFSDCEKRKSHHERPNTAPPKLLLLDDEAPAECDDWNLSESREKRKSGSVKIDDWSCEIQASSPYGSSPDPCPESKEMMPRTSTAASTSRFKPPESVGSPVLYSEVECGSFPFSNTEDGYEGDSSDTGSDWDWLSTVDTRRPVLPKFWLIMNVCHDKVLVYFHMRDRNEDDPELIQCKNIMNEVIRVVTKICKEVNQVLLLLSLYETRKCNRLLVPEDNDDLWKNRDLDANHSLATDEPESMMEVQEKYLEATLKLEPGAFNCPVVWISHFRLHHRLTTLHPGTTKSQGMQALRSVLNTFSVINRENMFVYQEDSGSVFYLRLYEENCEENHSGHSRQEDSVSLIGSCCSSVHNFSARKSDFEIETGYRSRVNSGASDCTRQETMSTSSASKKPQKCVALYVHGIGEVGTAISNDLIQVLQNRLNESVLDIIIGMLSRNPQCMLTPEDVQFIQNPSCPPTHQIHFTLPVKLLGHAHSLHIYLRQNLLHFLYNPKYTDNRPENHFKVYTNSNSESDTDNWRHADDNDIFLHYLKPSFGQPGGKGISCIVLSLVTGQGDPYHNFSNPPPNPDEYLDGLVESEFEDLTSTTPYFMKNDKLPGPVALIQFHIWSIGKDSIKFLEVHLKNAVQQAIWDLVMEYRALTAPIIDYPPLDESGCFSEPTTPIKVRRSGFVGIDSGNHFKDFPPNSMLQATKEISSSVPDITTKVITTTKEPQSARIELLKPVLKAQAAPRTLRPEKGSLNSIYHTQLRPFLKFGDSLGCPALHKSLYTLPSRQSVYLVSRDFLGILKSISKETPYMYFEIQKHANCAPEFIPFSPSSTPPFTDPCDPGTVRNFVCIGRNDAQWKAYMGHLDFLSFHESNIETMKNFQKYQTHICSRKNHEGFIESVPSSPTWAHRSSSTALNSPLIRSPSVCTSERLVKTSSVPQFVPRQRLYLMYIQDKEITLYLYNWPQDLIYTLTNQLGKRIAWHLQRHCLLNNIVLQKLGIFYGLSSFRVEKINVREDKTSAVKNTNEDSVAAGPATIEQLIRNNIHSKESSSNSNKITVSRSAYPAYLMRCIKNLKPRVPFHLSPSATIKDPLTAHGLQYLDALSTQRKDMQVLYNLWHSRGSNINYPYERVFNEMKRSARLSHYCLTPILFSPSWRSRLAPIRDHALEPLEQSPTEKVEPVSSSRSRHSSGSSLKNTEAPASSGGGTFRSRRLSGNAAYPNSNQSSPKLRMKTPSEETWHNTVCRHYLQEYVQYLHTLGFVSLQTTNTASVQSRRSVGNEEDRSRSDSFSIRHGRGPPVFYLIKCLLGGLLVFEVGLSEPYAYGHLYSVEGSRFKACSSRSISSQFIVAFLDEVDKVKLYMHLHSFTYDYHLRTIHSYISGRQLIFRHGYHLTSFLDDFIKYYQKAPTGAHNLLHAGTITISDTNISSSQLYNYIISHNQLYGMTVLRMVPVIIDTSTSIDTEFALVELSAQKASYKDFNDVFQMGNFDFGLLINQNTTEVTAESNALVLNFYIILTSQRDLYPKLPSFGSPVGSFQTVRYGSTLSPYTSRKANTIAILSEKEKFESSGEESSGSCEGRTKKMYVMRGMCDEEVTYLGYYSNQETMIQQVLLRQSEVAQKHLKGVVHRAAVHCRRDSLWSSLLPRPLKDENNSKEHSSSLPSSYTDFIELLDLVSVIPLNDIDEKLAPFMNMNISWYIGLAPLLKAKYTDSHREYKSLDGSSIHVVVTNNQCPDSFLLLSVDVQINRAELSVVFRENVDGVEHATEEPNHRTLALLSFIEDFVNACCFHLWTSVL